jgi:phenylacetate-CoA ligase
MDAQGMAMLRRLLQHPHAPRWNHEAGDRLNSDDLDALYRFREDLAGARRGFDPLSPPGWVLAWVEQRLERVPSFRDRVPRGTDLARGWGDVGTMSREDLALRLEQQVPDDADLTRLIVYRTAGTTGHTLHVPHHPRAAASYQVLIEEALAKYGVRPEFGPDQMACVLVGAQVHTVTYPCVLSLWNQSGFAKINLRADQWRDPKDRPSFFEDLSPLFLTGDPISFHEMMRLGIDTRPGALISTAVAMSTGLKERLQSHFGAPVIDWYSLTETGPIGYSCPAGDGYHLLPPDLFVEVVDVDGQPVGSGERGEIAVTGGRNPYLPLLRYRTGDWGRLDPAPCSCGDPTPRIVELEGREPVLFRNEAGELVNPVDLSRALRRIPLVQHAFSQRADLSCELVVRPVAGIGPNEAALRAVVRELLGAVPLHIRIDQQLGDRREGKVVPYASELLLED